MVSGQYTCIILGGGGGETFYPALSMRQNKGNHFIESTTNAEKKNRLRVYKMQFIIIYRMDTCCLSKSGIINEPLCNEGPGI